MDSSKFSHSYTIPTPIVNINFQQKNFLIQLFEKIEMFTVFLLLTIDNKRFCDG